MYQLSLETDTTVEISAIFAEKKNEWNYLRVEGHFADWFIILHSPVVARSVVED